MGRKVIDLRFDFIFNFGTFKVSLRFFEYSLTSLYPCHVKFYVTVEFLVQVGAGQSLYLLKWNQGRSGLGHDTELYRKRTAVSAARVLSVQKRQKLEEHRQLDFRERQRTVFAEKRAERDLYKSQKVCEQLDAQKVANVLNTTSSIVYISFLQSKIYCVQYWSE